MPASHDLAAWYTDLHAPHHPRAHHNLASDNATTADKVITADVGLVR